VLGLLAALSAGLAVLIYVLVHHPAKPDVSHATLLPDGYCDAQAAPFPVISDMSDAALSSWAAKLAGQMTPEEKHRLLRGLGWNGNFRQMAGWYVGNLLAVPRLGIPSVQMQDAMQGFRVVTEEQIGQVTAWPCALAVAAGWDAEAAEGWARAMGEEFRAKGANVVLGPSVNVHRVALNGRNAEYISGEDPALGAPLAAAYVRGMKDAGVATVVKHFLLNEQESNRSSMDAHADEQTLWERYYPPFEAAVMAGTAAVMCSYNYANGQQACSNSQAMTQDLKGRMGFTGWVMSDWGALKNTDAAAAGTDQDMPGTDTFFSDEVLAALPPGRLDDMVGRVLHGMARGSSAWRSSPPICRLGCNCRQLYTGVVATSAEHKALARRLAASGAVLLQNGPGPAVGSTTGRRPVLPLQQGERVAVLGSACARQHQPRQLLSNWALGDYYVVGGSGRVLAPHAVSVLEGLRGRGLDLQESASDSLPDAQAALQGADVAIVCGGATSAEASDRYSLSLDQEAFILQVLQQAAASGVPVVVVALAPGAIVAPWKRGAAASLAIFLSGQETGNAAADVLLGDVNPSGKLPVTFPEREGDAVQPCRKWSCEYTEKLRGGWHVYDGRPVAFPFGHGLSYTSFEYSVAKDWAHSPEAEGNWELSVRVRNVGTETGAEVVQLYVGYPPKEEGQPDLLLRGFRKTPPIAPGAAHDVLLSLAPRDLSMWDAASDTWRLVTGRFQTKVGSSSRDLRLCGRLEGETVQPMHKC